MIREKGLKFVYEEKVKGIDLYADKDTQFNPAYDKTYAQELNEQIRNVKLSLIKNKVYKMKGGKI